jgi:hypothetical protein
MTIDITKLKQLKQPVDLVLSYDLEKLRHEDEIKRASLWNQVKNSENLFEREFLPDLLQEERNKTISEFVLARLLLATAARVNNDQIYVVKQFSNTELDLISNIEKFNVFDILSIEEIADRMERQKDLQNLALNFYQNEYAKLDGLLEAPEVQKYLKIAFNLRYKDRLSKVVQGVQTFISKYGLLDTIGQSKKSISTGGDGKEGKDVSGDKIKQQVTGTKDQEVDQDDINPKKKSHWWKLQRMQLILSVAVAALTLCGLLGWQLIPWKHTYTLVYNVIPAEMGTILVNPLPDQDGKYMKGTKVTLVAKQNADSHFVKWSGDVQGTTPLIVITMNGNESVSAEFAGQ